MLRDTASADERDAVNAQLVDPASTLNAWLPRFERLGESWYREKQIRSRPSRYWGIREWLTDRRDAGLLDPDECARLILKREEIIDEITGRADEPRRTTRDAAFTADDEQRSCSAWLRAIVASHPELRAELRKSNLGGATPREPR